MQRPTFDRESLVKAAPIALPVLCLLASVWLKLTIDAGGPLWLDEGWTLAIVQAPLLPKGGAGFLQQLQWDPNPPFYFVTLKAWTWIAGLSNAALRTPSVLAALCGPLFALVPGTGLPRREKWLWAALLALWIPGVFFAQEARSYALLFGIECAAGAAFLRVLNRPSLREALVWCGVSSLAILTHQHALILAALQGFAFLALKRQTALRLWPAALLFLPAFAWLAIHAPRVADFAKPEFAWYPPMEITDAPGAVDFGFGGRILWVTALALGLVGHLWRRIAPAQGEEEPPPPAWQWALPACSLAAIAVVVALGYLRPSFAFRYLTPYGAGMVLAIPLGLKLAARGRAGWLGAVVMSFALLTGALVAATDDPEQRRSLQYEIASKDEILARAPHVAFLWDNPTNRVLAPGQRLALARAFFDRSGAKTQVTALTTGPQDDVAAVLYAAAPKVGDGFIWLYDLRVPGTATVAHPPRPSPLRPHLACARYTPDDSPMGVLACQRRPPRSPGGPPAPK